MFVVVSRFLIRKGYRGMAVFPFVVVGDAADKEDAVLVNHEKIHLRQQLELLILPFFVWYLLDFLIKWIRYCNWDEAYRNIVFEREAYANEKSPDYLQSRPLWNFLKYG